MRPIAWLAVLPLLCSVTAAQEAAASPWLTDYEFARSRARNEDKSLLMAFVGPTDAGDNGTFEREVMGNGDFLAVAAEHFVLARFDYPKDPEKVPEVLRRQNEQLLTKFPSPRLPAVWLTDGAGHAFATVGYLPVSAQEFLALLQGKRRAQAKAREALARAADCRGLERAKALAEGLRCLDDHIVASSHFREMLEIIQLDAAGAAGLKQEFDAIARDGAARPFLLRLRDQAEPLVAQQDWAGLDTQIEAARTRHGGARWADQYLDYLLGIREAEGDGDHAAALELFTAALERAPRSEVAPWIELRRRQAATAVEEAKAKAAAEAAAAAKEKARKKRRRAP